MDIRAIVLVGGVPSEAVNATERVAGMPIAHLDVLGRPIVERVLQGLKRADITVANIITEVPGDEETSQAVDGELGSLPHRNVCADQFWQVAEEAFYACSEAGADLAVLLRMGPYLEVDYEEFIQHHLDHHCAVTKAVDSSNSALNWFVMNASARSDAAELFHSRMTRVRRECAHFTVSGYVNHLRNAADLRRLTIDGLMAKNAIRPYGIEHKPGIWLGRRARVHPKARLVAPAYIGAHAKVRASALITRGSVVEHHAEVDCGTVVENSTVLPYTRLGAGLDVMHSVVGNRRLAHVLRGVEVEISDEKFVDMAPVTAVSRLAGSTAALFAFLPKQIYHGLFASSQCKSPEECAATPEPATAVLEAGAVEPATSGSEGSEFPSSLAVVRRYGNH